MKILFHLMELSIIIAGIQTMIQMDLGVSMYTIGDKIGEKLYLDTVMYQNVKVSYDVARHTIDRFNQSKLLLNDCTSSHVR